MARKTVKELQLARQEFIKTCQALLQPIFERWGLEFQRLSIENQNIPEQYRQALASPTLAQLESQAAVYQIQTEANLKLTMGRVDVELMKAQLEIGVDPLELKRIEAIEVLAANPPPDSLTDNRPQIVNQILAAPSPASPVMPVIMGSVIPPASLVVPPSLPAAGQGSGSASGVITPPASASISGPLTHEKIQEMLEKLDELLAKKLGPQWWLKTEIEQFAPKNKSNA